MSILNMQRSRTFNIPPRKLMLRQVESQVFVPPNKRYMKSNPDSILKRIWSGLRWRKWQIFFMILLGLVTSLLITLTTPVTYRATVQLQIAPEGESTEKPLFLANHYELLKSRLLARKVIDALGLSHHDQSQVDLQTTTSSLLDNLSEKARTLFAGNNQFPEQKTSELPQEEYFLANLTIEPIPDSTLLKVHYDSQEPAMAQQVANEIATQFIAMGEAPEATTTEKVKDVIGSQIHEAQNSLEKTEAALAKYAKEHEITATNGAPDPATDRLAQLEAAVTEAEKARIDAEGIYEQSRKGETIQFLTDNPAVRSLRDTYTKQQADYQEKLKFYKPEYPDMLNLQEQINITKKQIDEGIKSARDEVKTKYLTAQQKEATLRKERSLQKGKLLDIREKTVTYNALQREVETNRSIYDGLLQNIKGINSTTDLYKDKIIIIDPAILPYSQLSPDINLNLTLGAILGLVAGLGLALLREHFDDRINSRDTLENLLSLPVLGQIPYVKPMKHHRALLSPNPVIAEAFRSLRTSLMFSINLDTNPVIHVTSATAGEGKTDVCINMACSFAQAGKKVLLVDANLRKPSLHQKLDIDNSEGFTQFLTGQMSLKQLIRTTQIPNVYMIPAGPSISNFVELLLDNQMHVLTELMPREFDLIIIDSPPVSDKADALVLAHWASITLLVAAHRQSREKTVLDAYYRLRQARSLVVGLALTKA